MRKSVGYAVDAYVDLCDVVLLRRAVQPETATAADPAEDHVDYV